MKLVHDASQAAKFPPGHEPGSTISACTAYAPLNAAKPRVMPAAMKTHPIRLSGRLAATTVPIEMPTMLAITDSAFGRLQSYWLAADGTTAARSVYISTRPAAISA